MHTSKNSKQKTGYFCKNPNKMYLKILVFYRVSMYSNIIDIHNTFNTYIYEYMMNISNKYIKIFFFNSCNYMYIIQLGYAKNRFTDINNNASLL